MTPLIRLALLIMVAAASACGVPTDRAPHSLPGGVVHPVLPATSEESVVTGDRAAGDSAGLSVFLVKGSGVIAVRRIGPAGSLETALDLLLAGPVKEELDAGVRTAITPGTRLHSARLDGSTAVVDLTAAFVDVGGEEQILAVAQVVLTATAVAGVEQVRVALDGNDVEIPLFDGTLAQRPLTAADYTPLVAS